jgi:hypothetical protein
MIACVVAQFAARQVAITSLRAVALNIRTQLETEFNRDLLEKAAAGQPAFVLTVWGRKKGWRYLEQAAPFIVQTYLFSSEEFANVNFLEIADPKYLAQAMASRKAALDVDLGAVLDLVALHVAFQHLGPG